MAKNITMCWLNNSNVATQISIGSINPLKMSPSNTVAQPTNWYYGYTRVQNSYIIININVSGWYSWLLTGPAGPGGPNSDYGAGFGGGGGAGSATAQQVYFAAGTTLCGILYESGPQPNVLMLTNNTTTNCVVDNKYYSIVNSDSVYYAQYNGIWYPANTAVQGYSGQSPPTGYGGQGGNGGQPDFNDTGSNSISNSLNTYSWVVTTNQVSPIPGVPNVQLIDTPTSYGGAGGNGGVYNSSGEYNGQIGTSYSPATNGTQGGENPGYVTFTCNDGMSVVINTGGVQNAGSDTGLLMFYYCSP